MKKLIFFIFQNFQTSIPRLIQTFLIALCVVRSVPPLFASGPPLFIENKGQWSDEVKFRCLVSGAALFLRPDGYSHVLYDNSILESWHNGTSDSEKNPLKLAHIKITCGWMHPVDVTMRTQGENSYYENFFIGNDSKNWAPRCRSFAQVILSSPESKIDQIWYAGSHKMKYDLLLKPGFDPSILYLNIEGAEDWYLDEDGNLIIKSAVGYVKEEKPRCWYRQDPEKLIPSAYSIVGNRIYFIFPEGFRPDQEIILDPAVYYGTFSGSTADNFGFAATYDAYGNAFIGGNIFNVGYPSTPGVFQPNFAFGLTDVSVTKFNPTLTANLWSTYLGGSGAENPHSLVVNNYGDLFILGTTGSSNFPTTANCFDNTFNQGSAVNVIYSFNYPQGSDIFISRIKSDGTQLLASTYVGGNGNDGLNLAAGLDHNYADIARGEIDIDLFNNIYVASVTTSNNFPGTQNTFGPSFNGGSQDAIVFKMDNNLTTILWAGYLGGSGAEAAYSLAIEKGGQVVVAGGTNSNNFPTTGNPGFSTYNGNIDGFITRIKADGSQILNSIYFGTPQYDQIYFVETNNISEVYAFGQTNHTGTNLIQNATYSVTGGGQFVSKLNSLLNSLIWSTQWGTGTGQPNISPTAFLVDVCNKVYMCGWGGQVNNSYIPGSSTTGLPTTPGAIQTTTTGSDFYIMIMEEFAAAIYYATFYGGPTSAEHVDGGTSRFSRKGEIYQAVCGGCGGWSDFPTTPGAWSATNNSTNCNNAIFKVNFDFPLLLADFTVPPALCAPATITFNNLSTNGVNYAWNFGNGQTSTLTTPTITYTNPGIYNVTLTAYNTTGSTCNQLDSIVKQVYIFGNSTQQQPLTYICDNQPSQIGIPPSGDPSITYTWIPAAGLSSPTISNPILTPQSGINSYSLLVSNGICTDTLVFPIVIQPLPSLALNDTVVCEVEVHIGFPATITGASYSWTPAHLVDDPSSANPTAHLTQTTTFSVLVTLGNCTTLVTRTITVLSLGNFNTPDTTICKGDIFQITDIPLIAGFTAQWSPSSGLSSTNSLQPFANPDVTTTYTIILSNGVCQEVLTKTIQVIDILGFAGNDTTICLGDSVLLGPVNPLNALNYTWAPSTGLSASHIPNPWASPTSATTYILTTSTNSSPPQCVRSDTVHVNVFALLAGGIFVEEFASCLGLSIRLSPDPPGLQGNITWLLPDGSSQTGPQATLDVPFDTTLQMGLVVQNGSCRDTILHTHKTNPQNFYFGQLLMPNVFTPANSPNLNDCFAPIGLSDCFDLMIYNRWGNLIFDSRELNKKCWDGRIWKSDHLASDGVYFYILDAFGQTVHGTVTLTR